MYTWMLSCARPTDHAQLTSVLHHALRSLVSCQMPRADRAVGGPPCSPGHPRPLAATLHKAAHSQQLPVPLCSSKYCISCGGPGLRALLQLGRLGLAAGRRNRDYVSWAQSSKGQKAALGGVRNTGKQQLLGSVGLSLSPFLSCDGWQNPCATCGFRGVKIFLLGKENKKKEK